ncbi:hypothetical protein RJ639_035522 [Escallonia herrerae]|uniref:Uncharacterized protein n=1 Tax=Escallonia herrerae TaxID=1293975 RepID=A0AA88WRL4_9ASTE|nr:hypothetical protein RJ639_037076 [Escallonia herrerae]KAK3032229.1 hypothetical protein RJ639_035522 [Escallonia herrerae]
MAKRRPRCLIGANGTTLRKMAADGDITVATDDGCRQQAPCLYIAEADGGGLAPVANGGGAIAVADGEILRKATPAWQQVLISLAMLPIPTQRMLTKEAALI